ncbi:MAG: hypothetical protein ACI8QZ_000579 [Chlamydiales bacterium]|jgi:hypothetical protein
MDAEQETSLTDQIRDRFKADAPGAPVCEKYAEELVAGTLASAVRADADPSAILEQVLAGVVKGVTAAGAPLWLAARGAMLGALRSSGASGMDHRAVLEQVPTDLVRLADAGGGDFGAAAKGAVEGAIEAAEITGIRASDAAEVAASAAYRAAVALRPSAGIRIRHITTPAVRGIPIVLRD